jgi:pyrroline-5-carboxylate reductase
VKTIAFLGGGRITSALLAGLMAAKFRAKFVVHDRHPEKVRSLQKEFGVATEPDVESAVRCADLLVVAVRPQSVRELLGGLSRAARSLPALSLAAGITLDQLKAWSSSRLRWARAMPSPACRTRHGLTALAFQPRYARSARRLIESLFAAVGEVLVLRESQFDAFTVLYSVSHGQHALYTMTQAGVKLGLRRNLAEKAAAHALCEGILSLRASRAPLEELLREAATPGGTSAAVMASLKESGYRDMLERGLRAGVQRAKELGGR